MCSAVQGWTRQLDPRYWTIRDNAIMNPRACVGASPHPPPQSVPDGAPRQGRLYKAFAGRGARSIVCRVTVIVVDAALTMQHRIPSAADAHTTTRGGIETHPGRSQLPHGHRQGQPQRN